MTDCSLPSEADTSRRTPQYRDRRPSSAQASRAMAGNRSRDTTPELALRRALWARGLRYRLHASDLPGRPDIVFRSQRVAVFCDGDFWHGRDWDDRRQRLRQGANADYWVPKIQSNIARDARCDGELAELGWSVIRLWESDIRRDPEAAADRVEEALQLSA